MWVKKLLKSLGLRGGSRVLVPTAGFPTPQSGEGGPWRKYRIMTVKPTEFVCRIQYDLQTLNQGCHSLKASILPEASHCLHAGAQEQISLLCQTCCGTLEIPKAAAPQVQPESPHTEQAAHTFGKMVNYVEPRENSIPRPPLLCPIRPPKREQMDSIYKTTQISH